MSTANCRRSRSPSSFIPKASARSTWSRKTRISIRRPTSRPASRSRIATTSTPSRRPAAPLKGASAIVFVQTCAAEKRRRRKRGLMEDPARRVMINPAVCEGCGDCSVQSNCISVEPLETEMGRKRTINQSTCNKDYSCLKGFCPSFVTIDGGKPRRRAPANLGDTASATSAICRSRPRCPRWSGPTTSRSAASAAPAY